MGYVDDVENYFKRLKQAYVERRYRAMVIPIIGLAVVIGLLSVLGVKIYEWVKPEPKSRDYKIALVGPVIGREEQTWACIKAGIDAAVGSGIFNELKGKNINVQFITYDDKGIPEMSQQIAETICKDESFIMVIGFVESTVAKQALTVYNRFKMPVVLVATTSTDLTKPNQNNWTYPVLRLPPSNYQQAMQIVSGLGDTFATKECNLLVLKDKDNAAYSENLSVELDRALKEAKRTRCIPKIRDFDESNLKQMLEQMISNKSTPLDTILFLGMTDKAIQLVRTLAGIRKRINLPTGKPVVIISDGSTTQQFITEAGEDAECVWGVFPFGAPRDYFDNIGQDRKSYADIPSFYAYGHDAVLIAKQVLSRDSSNISRESIGKEFENLAKQKEFVIGMAGVYEFWKDGGLHSFWDLKHENQADQFHLWQVRYNNKGKLLWQHRQWRDSLDSGCTNKPKLKKQTRNT